MIASIRGKLIEKSPPRLMVDVGGVGYELQAPMSTFYHLPDVGEEVSLQTFQRFRDDQFILYAFLKATDKMVFCDLIKLNKVGPHVALNILSSMDAVALKQCIIDEDEGRLVCLPGIGAKTAKRIVFEMKSRLSNKTWDAISASGETPYAPQSSAEGDAREALIALGYRQNEAKRKVGKITTAGLSTEEIIRKALAGAS